MKNSEQFENGLSIVELENRYEMAASGDSGVTVHGGDWWGVGVTIPF